MMAALLSAWLNTLRIGLYKIDVLVRRGLTIGDISPCDFSGYVGLRDLTAWHAPALVGERYVVDHARIDWNHDSGIGSSWCFGYYVVDRSDTLVWLERSFFPPLLLADPGAMASVTPRLSLKSEFSGV